jgi:hypothetical protein
LKDQQKKMPQEKAANKAAAGAAPAPAVAPAVAADPASKQEEIDARHEAFRLARAKEKAAAKAKEKGAEQNAEQYKSLKEALPTAQKKLLKSSAACTAACTVVGWMWDTETGSWYDGKSGHQSGPGKVPKDIWGQIIAMKPDPDDSVFGRNCAEVQCIVKAYERKRKPDLTGCYFFAMNVKARSIYGPCRSCTSWISGKRGQAHRPHG